MDIGAGLPVALPDVGGRVVLDWARRADEMGFSSIAVTDRLSYSTYEPLATLAAAAAVTERARLVTAIVLGAIRANPVLFAKQVATVDRLSEGRVVLGLGAGSRQDDFLPGGVDFEGRGRDLDAVIETAGAVWRGERGVGPLPATPGGPPLLMGGGAPVALRRMARFCSGWVSGGGGPEVFRAGAEAARQAWVAQGRSGQPRLVTIVYFALGPGGRKAAEAFLSDYYSFKPQLAAKAVQSAPTSAAQLAETVEAYREAGCDEALFLPCDPDPAELDRLGAAVGLG